MLYLPKRVRLVLSSARLCLHGFSDGNSNVKIYHHNAWQASMAHSCPHKVGKGAYLLLARSCLKLF